ncbi:MAG TPA: efflux RND transporter periplasmic adaptor subunit [Steroidobacteraceae bacterium]|jgi:multidrug efflux system membrane fusion protein|nr:efflux RND transporter periplasmic adaptor subunit [Steroidobacteraceae bacterium]
MFARSLFRAPRKLGAAAALAGLLAAFLFWRLLESAPRPLPHPPVASITVAESREGSMPIYVSALGTVAPVYTVSLYSQVSGQVTRVYYREGQFVHRGEPLVEIDPRPYAATLEQAEGALRRDEGMLAEARMDLARYHAAYARNAVPRQQLQDQEQTVVQDEGTVESDRGAVAYDRVELAYCHILSPIDGRVGLRLVDPGNTVFSGTGSTLVVITQVKPITVVFDVSEDDLPEVERQLSLGRTLPVDVFDRSDAELLDSGALSSLDNEIDTTTGTLRFRAELPNDGLQLFPNQFVNARLQVRTLTNITLVPSSAVQHDGISDFVYVVRPNHTAGVQPVTVLASDGSDSAVRGLASGAAVATSGFNALDNGVLVSIRGSPAPTAPRVAKAS